MAQSLLIADPQNATIEELKQVSRLGSNKTATRCSAIQILLAGADRKLVCKTEEKLLERLDQAILEVIDKPVKTQQTTAIGTLF
jgi:septum formation topological specificity factor MinE